MIRPSGPLFLIALLTAALGGCTEDPTGAPDSESAPGFATPTIEVTLESAELPSWRDTTYWGFETPSSMAFRLIADGDDLSARPLGRFSTIPDSVFVDTLRVAIDSFTSAAIRITVDSALSTLPPGGVELAAWSLVRTFDPAEATWLLARQGEPWTTPGGDLGALLAADSIAADPESGGALADSVYLQLGGDVDSLLKAWRDADGEPGFAIVATGGGAGIRASTISLVAEAVPEGIDTVLTVVRGAAPSTFIFDPPTPQPTTRLRLAGVPSSRYYLDFTLPDSLEFLALRGSTINRATLEFRPTAAPPDPFALELDINAQAVRLLADPFVYGEKTPIGSTLGTLQFLRPDSLAAGNTMQFDITPLVRLWTQAPADSVPFLRVGILPIPASRVFGYWELFSREDEAGLRPVVHLLFTPNPSFLLP